MFLCLSVCSTVLLNVTRISKEVSLLMISYPATAVFRTPDGPVPAFSLVPEWGVDGPQKINKKITISSGDQLHVISEIIALSNCDMVVASTSAGWTAVSSVYSVPRKLLSLYGFHPTIGEKTQTVPDLEVQLDAFWAAVRLARINADELNGHILSRHFLDLGAETITGTALRVLRSSVGLLHTRFTLAQMRLWVYTVLVVLLRLGAVVVPKGSVRPAVKISMDRNFYRDMLSWYLHAFGCPFSIRYMPSRTVLSVHPNHLSKMLSEFFNAGMRPLFYELALLRKLVTRDFCVVMRDGAAHFTANIDNVQQQCVEEVEVKARPARMRAVCFPELGEEYIENNLLRVIPC